VDLIESGGTVIQETRLYDSDRDETRPMRSKEEANDYRYFPDPDLLPVEIGAEFVAMVRGTLPELPDEKAARFVRELGLSAYDAGVLCAGRELAAYFEAVAAGLSAPGSQALPGARGMAGQGTPDASMAQRHAHAKLAANWVMGELSSALNRDNLEIAASRVSAAALTGLLVRIVDATISGKIAKEVFEAMWTEGRAADEVIEARGLKQITDSGAIEGVIDAVLAANPRQLADYRAGKDTLFRFFVGQVQKATGGKANPAQVNDLLKAKLGVFPA
jgi:aspartyl-tRNA(Asn)/glutamyl-tRNA(Gln) amidotransferase subunit B